MDEKSLPIQVITQPKGHEEPCTMRVFLINANRSPGAALVFENLTGGT